MAELEHTISFHHLFIILSITYIKTGAGVTPLT